MSRAIFENALRRFVAEGSAIPGANVIPGEVASAAPDGLYASVTHVDEMRVGRPIRFQRIGADSSYTQQVSVIDAQYSVQFYRAGALEAASRFVDWVSSESGLAWAATAIVDGRIEGVNVYEGGRGYETGDLVRFSSATEPGPTIEAVGVVEANLLGGVVGITLRNAGLGYWDVPSALISSSGGTGATASPRGFGFVVKSHPQARNITDEFGGDFEERAYVELRVCYERPFNDLTSGRVERVIGSREVGGAIDILDTQGRPTTTTPPTSSEDKIVYVFQTNLQPSQTDSLTMVGEPGDGIAVRRIAEWTTNGIEVSESGSGFADVAIFSLNPIVPQHGRDLIRTSPFSTQYEGHVTFTIPTITSGAYTSVYYVRTTHYIPNQPNLVSVRAFKHHTLSLGGGLTTPIALSGFDSHTILSNDIPGGGVIGLQIELGFALLQTGQTEVDQLLKELNTRAAPSLTPIRGYRVNLAGFNSRVTFTQFDLATA